MPAAIYQYRGIKGLNAIAQHVGIPRRRLEDRITRVGMSLEEAIRTPAYDRLRRKKPKKGRKIVWPTSLDPFLCIALGIEYKGPEQ